jgi:predicted transglutaminase-like cysteine proteinase
MPKTASACSVVAAAFLSCVGLASPTVGDAGRTAGLVEESQSRRLLASLGERVGAMPVAYAPVAAGGSARSIAGWVRFCRTYVDECRIDPAERDTVRLTPALWRAVNEVNSAVNAAITPLTDVEHWGELDRWDLAEDGTGDCEDYQLLKRRKLTMMGIPRRAMVMTVVLDERNDGHAVLMLRTDRGDLILDNKRDEILSWHRTGYVYVKRESQTDLSWVSLNHVSGVGTTASR